MKSYTEENRGSGRENQPAYTRTHSKTKSTFSESRARGSGNYKMHRERDEGRCALLGQMQLWKATRNVCNWDRWPVVLSRRLIEGKKRERESEKSKKERVCPSFLLEYVCERFYDSRWRFISLRTWYVQLYNSL